jgi:hypothetical protein
MLDSWQKRATFRELTSYLEPFKESIIQLKPVTLPLNPYKKKILHSDFKNILQK